MLNKQLRILSDNIAFIYFVLTFVYIIISFYLTDFKIRCILGWEYSADDEKKHAVYDGGGAAY